MNHRFTVSKYAPAGRSPSWKVEGRGPDGKKLRRFFRTREEAQSFAGDAAAEVKATGWKAMGLADDQRTEAAKCYELLAPSGHSLTEAVTFYLAHVATVEASREVRAVAVDMLEAKESKDLSAQHIRTMRYHFRRFAEAFGSRKIATVTRKEIESWLHRRKLPPSSYRAARTHIRMLFNYAIKSGVAKTNPANEIELPKIKAKPPEILTPGAMRRLLTECRTHHPDILAAMLIQSFAGLRREECVRLDWREVRLDRGHIEVTAENSKTAQRRLVTIRPNLAAFLATLRRESGPVVPNCYNVCATELRARVLAAGHKYGRNALRHSFASYHLADCQDAAKTALQMGHKGTGMLFEHYRELVTPEDAAEWWGIAPGDTTGGNIVTLAAPAAGKPRKAAKATASRIRISPTF